jgi:para-aminobenzoate synthetase/4-amino-4-deoxychorismate lyase
MIHRHPLPAEVYMLVERTPATVLLQGCGGSTNISDNSVAGSVAGEEPWTQLFTAPLRICAAYREEQIPALFAEIERAVAAGQYAAGFVSYECGQCFEPGVKGVEVPEVLAASSLATPLAWFGIYERSYVFDNVTGTFLHGAPPGLEGLCGGAERASRSGVETLVEARAVPDEAVPDEAVPDEAVSDLIAKFALTEAEYARRIAAIHEWIRAGDVYQLNFTAPWTLRVPGSAAALYARLRARQPAEYGVFLHWQRGRNILSFSPELFFRVEEAGGVRRITTRPMKGTAPRGRTTREDRKMAEWLRNDPKNRSENVMIVDLERNDLGRLARFGTVRAEKLFEVERLPTLWQMTSTVTAELRPEIGYAEIFRALFPCGSITGAPKVRAMRLIAEIERRPRGVYTGAIGFFSPRRSVFNVAIRTLCLDGEAGAMGAGSGIVIDSDAAGEYRECLLKAEFLTRSAERFPSEFSLVETMLWRGAHPPDSDSMRGSYPFLELHLDRLEDSAQYFGFPCERAAVKAALEVYARGFAVGDRRKVRLLLDSAGRLRIADETLPPESGEQRVGRVCVAQARTDPSDPMFFHKTTHRPAYAQAHKEAVRAGFDDVLFLNLRGELTEGTISNVFLEKNGRWLTPPVECGLLPGVYRRHLLETRTDETRTDVVEQRLREEDLRTADAIYLANAVRGLRRVQIE